MSFLYVLRPRRLPSDFHESLICPLSFYPTLLPREKECTLLSWSPIRCYFTFMHSPEPVAIIHSFQGLSMTAAQLPQVWSAWQQGMFFTGLYALISLQMMPLQTRIISSLYSAPQHTGSCLIAPSASAELRLSLFNNSYFSSPYVPNVT